MYIRDWFIRWLFEYGDRKKYKGLPRGCWNCEVLGLCRRPKEEGWKCYNGCRVIKEKEEKERKLIEKQEKKKTKKKK